MPDLGRLQQALEGSNISQEEIAKTLLLIAKQPREHWPELKAVLGLDGVQPRLNSKAQAREKAVADVLQPQ